MEGTGGVVEEHSGEVDQSRDRAADIGDGEQ